MFDLRWLAVFNDPALARGWTLADWDPILRVARSTRLLPRLHAVLERQGQLHAVPAPARRHLVGAAALAAVRRRAVQRAIERIPVELDGPAFPLVLLKGAAYMAQDLAIGAGRMPSDLDILVPPSALAEVRFRLHAAGWREPSLDAHDQRYYLEWSHELPPMTHPRQMVELDVHHAILPPRRGRMPDTSLLLERLQPTRWPAWKVLSPVDQVLHSAGHLFFDAEPSGRLRDIVDLDGLLRLHAGDDDFWPDLLKRARQLDLAEPLVLAVYFTRAWMGTPLPPSFSEEVGSLAAGLPTLMLWRPLFAAVLSPSHPDEGEAWTSALARNALLARYHAHRLPPSVLLPHLWRKWRRRRVLPEESGAAA